MTIIHAMNTLPRLVSTALALAQRLNVMLAVVVTGAQQTGKSTLAEQLVQGERALPFTAPAPSADTKR